MSTSMHLVSSSLPIQSNRVEPRSSIDTSFDLGMTATFARHLLHLNREASSTATSKKACLKSAFKDVRTPPQRVQLTNNSVLGKRRQEQTINTSAKRIEHVADYVRKSKQIHSAEESRYNSAFEDMRTPLPRVQSSGTKKEEQSSDARAKKIALITDSISKLRQIQWRMERQLQLEISDRGQPLYCIAKRSELSQVVDVIEKVGSNMLEYIQLEIEPS